jgi:hypothetical protein
MVGLLLRTSDGCQGALNRLAAPTDDLSMHTTHTIVAGYRLLLVDGNNLLKSITLAPAVTYALGFGALYGVGRCVRDVVGAYRGLSKTKP